jgi:hypothetical protein
MPAALRHQDGLESVKKTLQVARVGTGFPMRCPLFRQRPGNTNPTSTEQACTEQAWISKIWKCH